MVMHSQICSECGVFLSGKLYCPHCAGKAAEEPATVNSIGSDDYEWFDECPLCGFPQTFTPRCPEHIQCRMEQIGTGIWVCRECLTDDQLAVLQECIVAISAVTENIPPEQMELGWFGGGE